MAYLPPKITNALGKSVAEQKTDFFLTFETVTSTTPELIDQSNYKITYIVDGQGNTQKPSEDNPSAFNILQSFQNEENVTIILDQATSENAALAGQHKIKFVGQPLPYLFSQNSIPSGTYEHRLSFRPIGAPPSGSYDALDLWNGSMARGQIYGVPEASDNDAFKYLGNNLDGWEPDSYDHYYAMQGFDPIAQPDGGVAAFTGSVGHYGANANPIDDGLLFLQINFNVSLRWGKDLSFLRDYVDDDGNDWVYVEFRLQIGNDDEGWETFKADGAFTLSKYIDFPSEDNLGLMAVRDNDGSDQFHGIGVSKIFTVDNNFLGLVNGKKIRWVMATNHFHNDSSPLPQDADVYNRSFVVKNQSPLPDDYFAQFDGENPDLNNSPYFWSTASADSPWITASVKLSEFYEDNIYVPTGQQTNFGFGDNALPFVVTPGDRIRFQYNPNQTFTIYEVIDPSEGSGELKLKLDRAPLSSSLQNFVLYTIDNSLASNIIIDVEKKVTIGDPENPFTGIILPEYPSDNIQKNLDNILIKLKSEGILKN